MKRFIISLALVFTLMLVPAVSAMKPLIGSMELDFFLDNPVWRGTITGDISGKMYFYNIGTGKPFDPELRGNAIFFGEIWLITDEEDNMLLTGTDEGVVSLGGSEYRMNGVVTDAASQWSYLIGRNVHMSGYITWQVHPEFGIIPATAPGTFRVN